MSRERAKELRQQANDLDEKSVRAKDEGYLFESDQYKEAARTLREEALSEDEED